MSSLAGGKELDTMLIDVRPLPLCYIPRRYLHAILFFFGVVGAYLLRTVLSVAIVVLSTDHDWSKSTQGLILSAFFWGYFVSNIPSAYLVHRFGVKRAVGVGLVISAASTVALPFCVFSVPLMVTVRVVLGLGEAVMLPAAFHLVSTWFPQKEQSAASAFIISGTSVGVVIAMGFTPLMTALVDWQSIFYIASAYTFLWLIFWLVFYTDKPDGSTCFSCLATHPIEVASIESERDEEILRKRFGVFDDRLEAESVPWATIFTHRAVVALLISHFCHMFGNYLFQSWLPTYLKSQLGWTLEQAGLYSDIPFFVSPFILFFSGVIVDIISVRNSYVSLRNSRKIFNGLSQILPAITMLILAFARPSQIESTILILISATTTAFSGGMSGNFIDLSPKYSSIIFAYVNTIGTIPGFAGVYATGVILDLTDNNWAVIFCLGAGLFVLSTVIYSIFGQARRIDFDGLNAMPCASVCTGRYDVAPWERYEAGVGTSELLINTSPQKSGWPWNIQKDNNPPPSTPATS